MANTLDGKMFYGWRIVAACFVIAAVAWSLGLFGASVYLHAITETNGWSNAEVSFPITVFFLVSACIQRLIGKWIDDRGPRPVLLSGAFALSLGVALIGQCRSPWHLYPCFVLIGVGWAALSTTGISTTVAPWFERHQGRSMTLAIMGASVGAIAGVPLLLWIVSKAGLAPGLIIVACCAVAVLTPLIGGVLRYRGPGDLGLGRDGDRKPVVTDTRVDAVNATRHVAAPRYLLWTAAFGFAIALTVQIGFITHHVALSKGMLDLAGSALLVSATGGTAFLGRIVLATIIDRINPRVLAIWILLAQAAALGVMSAWPSREALIGASLVYGYGIGHVTTLGPVVVRREFGAPNFGATYGTAATLIQFSSAFGPALLGLLKDSFGGYQVGLSLAAIALILGAASLGAGAMVLRLARARRAK